MGHKSDKNFENMRHFFWDTRYDSNFIGLASNNNKLQNLSNIKKGKGRMDGVTWSLLELLIAADDNSRYQESKKEKPLLKAPP